MIKSVQLGNLNGLHLAKYGKCSKISNTFQFLFLTKMWVIRAGINKIQVRIANREDPSEAV